MGILYTTGACCYEGVLFQGHASTVLLQGHGARGAGCSSGMVL